MVQQLTTAVSDAVLALVSMRAAIGLLSVNFFASIGFGLLAGAASFGVMRFSQSTPNWNIVNWHKYLSWLTAASGIPLIACGYFRQESITNIANLFLAAAITMVILSRYASGKIVTDGANVMAAVGLGTMLLDGVWRLHLYVSVGAACFITAATVIGTEGFINGFRRVDAFHYLLAISVICFTIGFNTSETPIFYRG
ncbi:hypothetical protein CAPTEDRAFT_220352 [Capitella teleta]|uniref:Uncharacterized protein n=1 Tax=Capitella teleta TaxID=283909 RepID=R7UYZ8_CAPTE|nr:hypothetical protein CAPTEDRAFT_220352 [Capitella teleta]|eukprot:ELU11798.1 hypothetical protein CAPTEDRAFT_220352 [Capitella teleta]